MSMTVVGVFNDANEAKAAVDKLVSAGYVRGSVDVSPYTGEGYTADKYTEEDHDTGIGEFFRNLFGDDEDDAHRYSAMSSRRSIVTVHANSEAQAEKAADIMDNSGAINVRDTADEYGYSNRAVGTAVDTDLDTNIDTDVDQKVKIIEENLEVGKRTVETGGIRMKSRIVSRPVEESIRLREERVTVNRTPVNRPATDADLDAFKEGEVVMTEHAEKAVVSKNAQVVEEVSLGKTVEEHEEKITDTVRKTEVDVEKIAGTETRTTNTPPKKY